VQRLSPCRLLSSEGFLPLSGGGGVIFLPSLLSGELPDPSVSNHPQLSNMQVSSQIRSTRGRFFSVTSRCRDTSRFRRGLFRDGIALFLAC
jgi:hypothetical protein